MAVRNGLTGLTLSERAPRADHPRDIVSPLLTRRDNTSRLLDAVEGRGGNHVKSSEVCDGNGGAFLRPFFAACGRPVSDAGVDLYSYVRFEHADLRLRFQREVLSLKTPIELYIDFACTDECVRVLGFGLRKRDFYTDASLHVKTN